VYGVDNPLFFEATDLDKPVRQDEPARQTKVCLEVVDAHGDHEDQVETRSRIIKLLITEL
jgi:uncharacterized Rossmann fold enzyme